MCVILAGIGIPKDAVEYAKRTNPDGYSVYTDASGLIKNPTAKEQAAIYRQKDVMTIYHFRIGTSGVKNPSNVHPFKVCNGKYYLYHNGVLGAGKGKKSDTQCLGDLLADCDFETAKSVLTSLSDNNRFLLVSTGCADEFYTFGKWCFSEGILSSHEFNWHQTFSFGGCRYAKPSVVTVGNDETWDESIDEDTVPLFEEDE